jgi:integrase
MKRTGSVTPVTASDGRQRWRVRLSIDGRRESLGIYDAEADARRVLAAALRQTEGRHGMHTLRSWGRQYLDLRAVDGYHRDERRDRSRWDARILKAPFADDPLDAITSRAIRQWVRDMVAEEAARTTVTNALCLLRVALEAAVEAEELDANPARGVRVPKMARDDEGWTWLAQPEIDRLLTCRVEPVHRVQRAAYWHQRTALTVAVYTGLRAGELWGLRWRDVDLGDRPHLVVRRSRQGATKGGRVREVPLLPPALGALREWRRRAPGLHDALVWPADGGGCHASGYDAQIHLWLRDAGIVRRVRLHDLRHTCASHLVQGTWGKAWRLEDVRQWLGHVDQKTTQRYAHLAPDGLHGRADEARKHWTLDWTLDTGGGGETK